LFSILTKYTISRNSRSVYIYMNDCSPLIQDLSNYFFSMKITPKYLVLIIHRQMKGTSLTKASTTSSCEIDEFW